MACHNVREFGAIGNGSVNDTLAIQKAIDKCYEEGGGRVVVPSGGVYLTGTLVLKSNIELFVERGATILGSSNIDDYSNVSSTRYRALITACDSSDISITGGGVIDGNGRMFIETALPYIYIVCASEDHSQYS